MSAVRHGLACGAIGLLALMAGCGDGDGSTDDGTVAAATTLSITITGERSTRAFTLRCDPDGGTWPDAATACRGLSGAAGDRALEPITIETRDLVPITDTPVTVTGTRGGARVAIEIPARGSSTRRARFAILRAALGATAFDEAARSVR